MSDRPGGGADRLWKSGSPGLGAPAGTEWEMVVGLEVHAELLTATKLFSASPNAFGGQPNTHIDPVCLGLPGTLPVLNRRAVELAIRVGLALGAEVRPSIFARKNYYYPDMPKNYQISQYDRPINTGGSLELPSGKAVGIVRAHLEEDTGKSTHLGGAGRIDDAAWSLVDYNRAGVPLLEIVSHPDLRSAAEAREYVTELRATLLAVGASDGKMEEGSLRVDANVSVRPRGSAELGTRCEVKNVNSLRSLGKALEHEARRQIDLLSSGRRVAQETRHWNEDTGRTSLLRSKEEATDYRYFPEPDLPPLSISREEVESLRSQLPELPEQRRARFQSDYGLGDFEASLLTEEPSRADYFDQTIAALSDAANAKEAANWITGDLFAQINKDPSHPDLEDQPIRPAHIAELVGLIVGGDISRSQARTVFESMYESGDEPATIVKAKGLAQISGEDALTPIINQVIGDNPDAVNDYRTGKEAALKYLVGQVMRHSRGQANPAQASELLVSALSE